MNEKEVPTVASASIPPVNWELPPKTPANGNVHPYTSTYVASAADALALQDALRAALAKIATGGTQPDIFYTTEARVRAWAARQAWYDRQEQRNKLRYARYLAFMNGQRPRHGRARVNLATGKRVTPPISLRAQAAALAKVGAPVARALTARELRKATRAYKRGHPAPSV